MSDRPLRSLGTKMARFAVVGLANTVIDLAAFSVLLWLSTPPLAANVGAWFVAVLFSFAANGLWSFERDRSIPLGNAFFRFISLGALISLGVSSLSIAALAGWTGVWPAKIGGVVVAAALNFLAARWSIEGRLVR
ncbi:GtrA family protein [Mesorhizobium sp. SP-1A]|uniref:GtrA family protein n=1 Tax=Mesorhizobium sp. SP-1A TaxID=3077840 RepID=UPI0028F702FF|nr:GtrA family protein [Mesorhizobium sp. SP-1A]